MHNLWVESVRVSRVLARVPRILASSPTPISHMEDEDTKRKGSGRKLLRYLRRKSHMKRKIMAEEVWLFTKVILG